KRGAEMLDVPVRRAQRALAPEVRVLPEALSLACRDLHEHAVGVNEVAEVEPARRRRAGASLTGGPLLAGRPGEQWVSHGQGQRVRGSLLAPRSAIERD